MTVHTTILRSATCIMAAPAAIAISIQSKCGSYTHHTSSHALSVTQPSTGRAPPASSPPVCAAPQPTHQAPLATLQGGLSLYCNDTTVHGTGPHPEFKIRNPWSSTQNPERRTSSMMSVWARRHRLAASGLLAILMSASSEPSARPTPANAFRVVPPSMHAASPVEATVQLSESWA